MKSHNFAWQDYLRHYKKIHHKEIFQLTLPIQHHHFSLPYTKIIGYFEICNYKISLSIR